MSKSREQKDIIGKTISVSIKDGVLKWVYRLNKKGRELFGVKK